MPIALQKPKVLARQSEARFRALLNELFKALFTGTPHISPLTGTEVTFPRCDLFFNQTQLPPAAARSQIHSVITDLRPREDDWDTAQKLVVADGILTIFIRTPNQGAEGNKADFENEAIADNLKEIFQSADRYSLAQKGIRRARIQRGPTPMQTTGFQVRSLTLKFALRYFIAK